MSKASEGELLVSVVYEEIAAENAAPINWNAVLLPVLGIVLGAGLLAGGWFGGTWLLVKRGQKKPAQPVGSDPYAGRPTMDTPELLYEMDRGLEEDR